MAEKSETLVATQALFVGTARAANPGDLIDSETAKNNGWTEGLARQGTKAAKTAQGIVDDESPGTGSKP